MKKTLMNTKALLVFLGITVSASPGFAQIITDLFDDDDLATNPDTGSGFNVFTTPDGGGVVFEEEGFARLDGGSGGAFRGRMGSADTFSANSVDGVTAVFVVDDFSRSASIDNGTTRCFVGLVQTGGSGTGVQAGGTLENTVDGLWVSLKSNETANGADNGEGALFYVDGNTVTELATWDWDQSLVSWDVESAFRSDRIAMDLLDPLTLTLTSNDLGYSLSFTTDGGGILPANISGAWADAGVANDLDVVHAAAQLQGQTDDRVESNFDVDSIEVMTGSPAPAPAPAGDISISDINYDPIEDRVTLTWNSVPGENFTVDVSPDLIDFSENVGDDFQATAVGNTTTGVINLATFSLQDSVRLFFRVRRSN